MPLIILDSMIRVNRKYYHETLLKNANTKQKRLSSPDDETGNDFDNETEFGNDE